MTTFILAHVGGHAHVHTGDVTIIIVSAVIAAGMILSSMMKKGGK